RNTAVLIWPERASITPAIYCTVIQYMAGVFMSEYVELHCRSNFSFLKGASFPEELVNRALELGYRGLALTDECSMAGVVRAHMAVKNAGERAAGFRLITGSEFVIPGECHLVLLAQNRRGYGQICALITRCRQQAEKGSYQLSL